MTPSQQHETGFFGGWQTKELVKRLYCWPLYGFPYQYAWRYKSNDNLLIRAFTTSCWPIRLTDPFNWRCQRKLWTQPVAKTDQLLFELVEMGERSKWKVAQSNYITCTKYRTYELESVWDSWWRMKFEILTGDSVISQSRRLALTICKSKGVSKHFT